jgi:hypothetical protein
MKLRSGIPDPVEYPVDLRVMPRAPSGQAGTTGVSGAQSVERPAGDEF